MKPKDLFTVSGTLKRYEYGAIGFLLVAVKYNLDRAIAYWGFQRTIYPNAYLEYFTEPLGFFEENKAYFFSLALTAIPFIAAGTLLTLKRLRDTGLPGWFVAFFFLPFLNLIFFALLSFFPSAQNEKISAEAHKRQWLDRVIPLSNSGGAIMSIAVTALFGLLATWLLLNGLQEYGVTLFVGLPFVQGMSSALIYGYHERRSLTQCLCVAIISVSMLAILILATAIEGFLCIAMVIPLAIPVALLGAALGYVIQDRKRSTPSALVVLVACIPALSGFEHFSEIQPELRAVTTEIIVNKPKQEVWNQLVTFNELRNPTEFLFKAGIAYPIKATIKGKGAGSLRECVFTTGAFIEPIEIWDEPNLLKFSVSEMPPPLTELSFYDSLHLPHLNGYFVSEKGQFKLIPLSNSRTLLQGTTWYRHHIWPSFYWRFWSEYILHTIHYRVLNHIKEKSESMLSPKFIKPSVP